MPPTANPLAYERLSTLMAEAVRWAHEHQEGPADAVMTEFTDVHFEYRTNGNGVRVRRVATTTGWETDPEQAEK